ncbi:MAG: NADH-quinone oxidoreductase subunit NuoB [Sporomusaceae bacterium]|nr:NADH-quinone oxidoreductase subunit NuoB [Sporomusaceae bacterium]
MINILRKILYTGTVTEDPDQAAVPPRARGAVMVQASACSDCRRCAAVCPVGAITHRQQQLTIDYNRCIFCGHCVENCEHGGIRQSGEYRLTSLAGQLAGPADQGLRGRILKLLGRSLQIRHLDAGSCNACDFEMAALNNPIYDLQQYGIDFVASPRHADLLMVTGVVTRNLTTALLTTYEAMPAPKLVMAVGACAAAGATFGQTYAIRGAVHDLLPVDIYVPGCPPKPQALLHGLLLALDRLS